MIYIGGGILQCSVCLKVSIKILVGTSGLNNQNGFVGFCTSFTLHFVEDIYAGHH